MSSIVSIIRVFLSSDLFGLFVPILFGVAFISFFTSFDGGRF